MSAPTDETTVGRVGTQHSSKKYGVVVVSVSKRRKGNG